MVWKPILTLAVPNVNNFILYKNWHGTSIGILSELQSQEAHRGNFSPCFKFFGSSVYIVFAHEKK
jgi:hypothetical protein